VIINDQDAQAAWSFTLLHELTHVWLGETGVSGAFAEATIEQFCNAKDRHLSRSMVACRLYQTGRIEKEAWSRLSAFFRQKWLQTRAERRERA